MKQSVTFENGHCVRHTVTKIHHEARHPHRKVQRQDKKARHVHGGHVENRRRSGITAIVVGACDPGGRTLGLAPTEVATPQRRQHTFGQKHLYKRAHILLTQPSDPKAADSLPRETFFCPTTAFQTSLVTSDSLLSARLKSQQPLQKLIVCGLPSSSTNMDAKLQL